MFNSAWNGLLVYIARGFHVVTTLFSQIDTGNLFCFGYHQPSFGFKGFFSTPFAVIVNNFSLIMNERGKLLFLLSTPSIYSSYPHLDHYLRLG